MKLNTTIAADPPKIKGLWVKKKVGEDQQHIVRLMGEVSGNDINFLSTMNAENGLLDMYRVHPYKNSNGTRDYSCGLNSAYHWPMIKRILDKSVSEKEIVEYCYAIYKKRHGAFYGYYRRGGEKNKFTLN